MSNVNYRIQFLLDDFETVLRPDVHDTNHDGKITPYPLILKDTIGNYYFDYCIVNTERYGIIFLVQNIRAGSDLVLMSATHNFSDLLRLGGFQTLFFNDNETVEATFIYSYSTTLPVPDRYGNVSGSGDGTTNPDYHPPINKIMLKPILINTKGFVTLFPKPPFSKIPQLPIKDPKDIIVHDNATHNRIASIEIDTSNKSGKAIIQDDPLFKSLYKFLYAIKNPKHFPQLLHLSPVEIPFAKNEGTEYHVFFEELIIPVPDISIPHEVGNEIYEQIANFQVGVLTSVGKEMHTLLRNIKKSR